MPSLIDVTVSDRTPLLMHKFTDAAALAIRDGHRAVNIKDLPPREQAEYYAYRDENTRELYIPGQAFYKAIINGGSFHKLHGRKVTTMKFSLITGAIELSPLNCGLGIKDYEVDSRAILNEKSSARVMLHRPLIQHWKVKFQLTVDDDFPVTLVRDIVDDAGRRIGVGSFRPERKGPFGKFIVTKWDVKELKLASAA